MIGGFALGLIIGLAMGVCLYREAYEYFRLKDAQEEKHRKHMERVREWERRQKAGIVWGRVE
jgi:hypothetical protein